MVQIEPVFSKKIQHALYKGPETPHYPNHLLLLLLSWMLHKHIPEGWLPNDAFLKGINRWVTSLNMQATSLDNYGGQVSEALLTCTYTLCHAFSERPIICFNIKWSLKSAYFCIWRNLSPTQCLFIKQTVFHCTLWTHLHLKSYIIQTYIDLNMLFMHKREFTRCSETTH